MNPDWEKATRGLGEDYHILHVTIKNHGCCGHAFPSIDGVLHLQREHKFAHQDIKCIKLATYKAGLDIIDNPTPEGEYQAKFSIQYTVAHALVHGSVRLDAFLPDRLNDADVRSTIRKIDCVADAQLSEGYPGQRAAQVDIELKDGRKLAHFQPYRKGDPESPLTDAELNDKFIELAQPVLGQAAASALLAQLWDTDKRANVEFETGGAHSSSGATGRPHA
jgi:2-methylcitrate dehydratase PrpD